ncbi:MAG TPA: LysR family transcriptional regulator [Bacillota bacterium]|nr:LysR family transcriptional regulator [Bacillota bacterium]
MMKIADYELLIKLAEIGTIRGTAKAVLISQPAVSQRLKYIEEYFGVQIFIRTQKKLLTTPSGEILLKHAKDVLHQEEVVKKELSQTSNVVQGTLSIACSSLISQRYLPSILATYTNTYPHVSIDLVTGISENIEKKHHEYNVCIIRGDRLKDSTCLKLFEDPLYILDTEPFPENEIKERPLLSFNSDDSMHELVDQWLSHQRFIKPQTSITLDQIETCKQFMKEGLGMAVLPKSVAEPMLSSYPHMPLEVDGTLVTRTTWVCFQEGERLLPQVDHFVDALLTETYVIDSNGS